MHEDFEENINVCFFCKKEKIQWEPPSYYLEESNFLHQSTSMLAKKIADK